MIVFWQEYWRDANTGKSGNAWRHYCGPARVQKRWVRFLDGSKRRISSYIAFDTRTSPPRVVSPQIAAGKGVDALPLVGEIAAQLPATYIDEFGNIRRIDADLSLVLSAPEWNDTREKEFQREIQVPF